MSTNTSHLLYKLTRRQKDAIEWLAWGMEHFGSLGTTRRVRRSTMMTLVKQGIAESVGQALMCDGDGFHLEPERYREGFRLTEYGQAVHQALMSEYERRTKQDLD